MLPFLIPLRESVWLKMTLFTLSISTISVGAWILGKNYLPVSNVMLGLGVGAITLSVTVILAKILANSTLQSADFLSRAILLVSHDENQVEPPDPNNLKNPSKLFLQNLATSVYNLASNEAAQIKETVENTAFLQSLNTVLPLPVIALNKNQQIIFVNEAATMYINKPAEECLNKPLYDVINLSFVSDMTLENWIAKTSNDRLTATEAWERVRITFEDQTKKQFDLSAHYSKDGPNGIEVVLALFDRTSHYERDDYDLTFVSLAVHELRTPLTIMRGYIEVFNDELNEKLSPEQTTFMHNMSASAQQLTAFVANILNVVKVEENALDVRLKEEKWPDVLLEACKDMELRATVHGKKLEYQIDDNLPTVGVDRVSIYEVMNNLIDNAIKYTHTGENIVICAYQKGEYIETTISDKGVGIPESLIAHVFDKFYRGHQSKNTTGGTGLGLYLSRAIVSAHGGTIWVKSKEGYGSTFGFTLPIYANIAGELKTEDNGKIVRGAHGWIKNHNLYRG